MSIRAKKQFTYDIRSISITYCNGVERSAPTAHIVVEFPQLVCRLPEFYASLEAVFAEIREMCNKFYGSTDENREGRGGEEGGDSHSR